MGLTDRFSWWAFRRCRERLMRASADPAAAQEAALRGLVQAASDTEWGRDHDYAGIGAVADFQARVPLAVHADLKPLWDRARAGEEHVCWPGVTRYFALSAGTTSGSKLVPVTADAIRSNRRSGARVVALTYEQMGRSDVTRGRFLYLGGSTTLRREGRAFIGDASGIMNAHVPRPVRRYHLPEPEIAALTDWDEKINRICRAHTATRVHVVSGLPSWLVPFFERLIAVGRERLGASVGTVADVWPHCGAVVTYGMSVDPYRETFDRLLGGPVAYVDTYSSSEAGMSAVQDRRDEPGMLLFVDNGVFYEFVPADEADAETPRRCTMADVEVDVPYEVAVSTNGGVWGYRLGDVVRFTSLRPPRVVFAGRTSHQLSAFGEHVIGEELDAAVLAAGAEAGAEVANFAVQAVYPAVAEAGDDRPVTTGRHRWHVEFARPAADPMAFMRAVDEKLKALNEDYASYRKGDRAVGEPELVVLAPGSFYEWMKRTGRLGGQYKIPRVLTDAGLADRLRAISDELGGGA